MSFEELVQQAESIPTDAPGWSLGVVDVSGKQRTASFGTQAGSGTPDATTTTQYDTASLTKSLCTGLLAHWLLEQKIWNLNDQLSKWLPKYTGDQADSIRIRDLLAFGVPFDLTLSQLKDLSGVELEQRILSAPVSGKLGEKPLYLNTTSILLGRAIEATTQESLPKLCQRLFWQPLGMKQTTFTPQVLDNIAPSEIDPWRGGVVKGQVHDESAWALRSQFVAGSAGMFSCVTDLLLLIQAILQVSQGEKSLLPLNQETVHSWSQNVFAAPHRGSLGWELNAPWMGDTPAGTFGKTGFTGCSVVINLDAGRAGVLLSNTTYPTRPIDRTALTQLRHLHAEKILFSDLL